MNGATETKIWVMAVNTRWGIAYVLQMTNPALTPFLAPTEARKGFQGNTLFPAYPLGQPFKHLYIRMLLPSLQCPIICHTYHQHTQTEGGSVALPAGRLKRLPNTTNLRLRPSKVHCHCILHSPAKCQVLVGRNETQWLVWGLPEPPFQPCKNKHFWNF